tara:strand:- start:12148 stop:13185 length:1038 start_codon:yes stop_codon:yes gene_type:complete
MFSNKVKKEKLQYEELHIRHFNLLLDLRKHPNNNKLYKMALINTFDDLKIFLRNLEKNKYKCTIAVENKKILGYLYTYPINNKKTCLKINAPEIIHESKNISKRDLFLNLIKNSISNKDLKISNWIINADINNNELISSSRELGFQPLQEIKIISRDNLYDLDNNNYSQINNHYFFERIDDSNVKKVLNFIQSNDSILIRNIYDLDHFDILKRINKFSGILKRDEEIFFAILKDNSYENEIVYSLIRGLLWDEEHKAILEKKIIDILNEEPKAKFKIYSNDSLLNSFLETLNLSKSHQELILVRNNLIKRINKNGNKINHSFESIFEKINPQGNVYPSPMPINIK